ncbi:hypothetical protein A4F85_06680 [Delftia sp. GW456-R20]|nr:hypothetical protein A4F85_06680 [Delftia sp. GW456-R20]
MGSRCTSATLILMLLHLQVRMLLVSMHHRAKASTRTSPGLKSSNSRSRRVKLHSMRHSKRSVRVLSSNDLWMPNGRAPTPSRDKQPRRLLVAMVRRHMPVVQHRTAELATRSMPVSVKLNSKKAPVLH